MLLLLSVEDDHSWLYDTLHILLLFTIIALSILYTRQNCYRNSATVLEQEVLMELQSVRELRTKRKQTMRQQQQELQTKLKQLSSQHQR